MVLDVNWAVYGKAGVMRDLAEEPIKHEFCQGAVSIA
jgi:hypothetical protein